MFLAAWEECTRIKLKYMVYDESILEHKHKKMLQSFEFCIVDVSLRRTFVNNNQFFKTSSRVIAVGLCVLSLNSVEARAEMEIMPADEAAVEVIDETPTIKKDVLTEEAIRAFYKQAADVQIKGSTETLAFLEKHTHENARNELHMRTRMEGQPPQKTTVISDKATVLKETKEAYEKGNVDSIETEIIEVDIADDGQSAKVIEKTSSDFTLSISETKTLLIASKQSCDTEVVLTAGVVQTKESECDVEVNVKPKK